MKNHKLSKATFWTFRSPTLYVSPKKIHPVMHYVRHKAKTLHNAIKFFSVVNKRYAPDVLKFLKCVVSTLAVQQKMTEEEAEALNISFIVINKTALIRRGLRIGAKGRAGRVCSHTSTVLFYINKEQINKE